MTPRSTFTEPAYGAEFLVVLPLSYPMIIPQSLQAPLRVLTYEYPGETHQKRTREYQTGDGVRNVDYFARI